MGSTTNDDYLQDIGNFGTTAFEERLISVVKLNLEEVTSIFKRHSALLIDREHDRALLRHPILFFWDSILYEGDDDEARGAMRLIVVFAARSATPGTNICHHTTVIMGCLLMLEMMPAGL